MSAEQLVLLKSRAQRRVEAIVVPAVFLVGGPAMRAVFGDSYSFFHGMAAIGLMIFAAHLLGNALAVRFGAEWISAPERQRRVIEESIATSPWLLASINMVAVALMALGLALVVDSFQNYGDWMGGAWYVTGFIVLMSSVAAVQTFIMLRRLGTASISAEQPPPGHHSSVLIRILMHVLVVSFPAMVVGLSIALQFDGAERFTVFTIAFIAVGMMLHLVLLRRHPLKFFPNAKPDLRRSVLLGLIFGAQFAFFSTGMTILEYIGHPFVMLIVAMVMLIVCALLGVASGVMLFLMMRFADARRTDAH